MSFFILLLLLSPNNARLKTTLRALIAEQIHRSIMSGGNKGKKAVKGGAFFDLGRWQSLVQRYAFAACLAAIAVVVYCSSSSNYSSSSSSSKDGPAKQVGII